MIGQIQDNQFDDLLQIFDLLGLKAKQHWLGDYRGRLVKLNPHLAAFKYDSNGNVVLLCRRSTKSRFRLLAATLLDMPPHT